MAFHSSVLVNNCAPKRQWRNCTESYSINILKVWILQHFINTGSTEYFVQLRMGSWVISFNPEKYVQDRQQLDEIWKIAMRLYNQTYDCWWAVTQHLTVIGYHYIDVIMTTIASQITSLTFAYSIVYSEADQRKHQSSASLAFVRGIHRYRWIPRTKGQ